MSTIKSICVYCASGLGTTGSPRRQKQFDPGRERHPPGLWRRLGRPMGTRPIAPTRRAVRVILTSDELRACSRRAGAIVTRDMHERAMFERADAFVALPAGSARSRAGRATTWRSSPPLPILILNSEILGSAERADRPHGEAGVHPPGLSEILVTERVEDILPAYRGGARRLEAEMRWRRRWRSGELARSRLVRSFLRLRKCHQLDAVAVAVRMKAAQWASPAAGADRGLRLPPAASAAA